MRSLAAALLLTASLAGPACRSQPAPSPDSNAQAFPSGRLMSPEKVADHVWVMRQPDRVWSAVIGNVVIIEQSDGIILVDSGGTIEDGKDVLAALKRITSKPVRAVIISHWHNDHPLGLPAITARYPDVRIIATKQTADDMAKVDVLGVGIGQPDPKRRDERFKASEERAAGYRKAADDAALPAALRREYAIEAPWVMERARRQLGNFVVLPTETFTDRLLLDDPAVPVEALNLGRANTRGDAFVWLPKQKVMVAGDAVVAPTPYGFTNPIPPWLATFDKLEAYPFTTLVPGHGKVQRDRAYLATLRWSMGDIKRQAVALAASEPDAETAFRRFDATEHRRRFAANDPWMQLWLSGYWLEGMFETAFNAAKGTGKDDEWTEPTASQLRSDLYITIMPISALPIILAVTAAQPSADLDFLIARNDDFSTAVHLVESKDEIRFEVSGPAYVSPSVSIDWNRNGKIDRNRDFRIAFDQRGPACVYLLLTEDASTDCQALGDKMSLTKADSGDKMTATFVFPKRKVSADGLGFGFAVKLWNTKANFGETVAGGTYLFGGTIELVGEGPTFLGEHNHKVPIEILPAVRLYEGCLFKGVQALQPLDKSKIVELKSIPASCKTAKTDALKLGTDALVAKGATEESSARAMGDLLKQLDAGIELFAQKLAQGLLPPNQ